MKAADFIEAPGPIQSIEAVRVARCELACLQVAATQICIPERFRALALEKMKAQPTPVHARNEPGFSKERDKEKQNEISIDVRRELLIAGEFFRSDLAN